MSSVGLWSLIKRSPKAKIKRKTFEVAGPSKEGAMALDARAKQIFDYFRNYNYTVKETGDVITFEGNYQASLGQAAALVLYTLISLASTALVLSIAAPFGGNWWYTMCLISPAAGAYYMKNANRREEFKVKMVTADDDSTTDIVVEGEVLGTFRRSSTKSSVWVLWLTMKWRACSTWASEWSSWCPNRIPSRLSMLLVLLDIEPP